MFIKNEQILSLQIVTNSIFITEEQFPIFEKGKILYSQNRIKSYIYQKGTNSIFITTEIPYLYEKSKSYMYKRGTNPIFIQM